MHLEHFVPILALWNSFHCIWCCIEDQLLFPNVFWTWWAMIRSQEQGWLEEERGIRNKDNKQDCSIAFNPTHMKTSPKFVIGLCFKGNPNLQGILNWIIQILQYYCRTQHKNIENSRIIKQNVAISLCFSLCLLRLALPSSSSTAVYFQFLDTVFNVTSDHSCCI